MMKQNFFFRPLFLLLASLLAGCRLLPAAPEAAPTPITSAPPTMAADNLAALRNVVLPPRDPAELAQRLRGIAPPERLAQLPAETVGSTAPFWYKNHDSQETERISARLAYRSPTLNLWFEEGVVVDAETLQAAATVLEQEIIPTNHAFFGREWQPGIDGDPRLNVLHLETIGGNVVGYFSAADEYVTAVNPYSNQREIFYIDLEYAPLGSNAYYEVIAHEMQHMIHWHTDSNEATWLDEGLSVLAAALNGYGSAGFAEAYATAPDVQLTHFDYESAANAAHYGASYLFADYYLHRFGERGMQALLQQPANGIAGVNAALAEMGETISFSDLFADWVVATYLAGSGAETPAPYNYGPRVPPAPRLVAEHNRFPLVETATVTQYGVDYVRLQGAQSVTAVFTGTRQVSLLPTTAHSGDYFWTTIPGDDADMTLTAAFDLRALEKATLSFWNWYDIEAGWDYGYVAVSADGGASWQLLSTKATTLDNPNGNSFGPGLTGTSGTREEKPEWEQQSVDLSAFAGKEILVRFEYVTDDALTRPGWAIDDVSIPELGFFDDMEAGSGRWQSAGFARHSNVLPQQFLVQLLWPATGRVERLSLDEKQQGRWLIPLDNSAGEAILVIAGTTPVTTMPASYSYEVTLNN